MAEKLAIHGGTSVVSKANISSLGTGRVSSGFAAPYDFDEQDIAAVTRVLQKANEDGSLTRGHEQNKFEKDFAALHDSKYGILVNSGTSAFNTIYGAINPDPGTEVICTPWTSAGSVVGGVFHGMVPVFADIDDTLCIDPEDVERKITSKTRVIIAVHMFGNACDMDRLQSIADKYNLFLVEDCSQATFSEYQGKVVGSMGDISGWSFSGKHMTGGGGGMITTSNVKLYERGFGYSDQALNRSDGPYRDYPYVHNFLAQNYKPNELTAAVLNVQLTKVHGYIENKIRDAKNILSGISDIPELIPQKVRPNDRHTYWNLSIALEKDAYNCSSKEFAKAVEGEGIPLAGPYIGTGTPGQGPLYNHPVFANLDAFGKSKYPFDYNRDRPVDYKLTKCPNGEDLMGRGMGLSMRGSFTEENVGNIIESIRKVSSHYKK